MPRLPLRALLQPLAGAAPVVSGAFYPGTATSRGVTFATVIGRIAAGVAFAGGLDDRPGRSQPDPPAWGGPKDPGPRGGAPGAGGALPGLAPAERCFFAVARARFRAVD